MNSHERAQELISARMDAPLTPVEHRELQGHLADCTGCRVFVTQSGELARGMQEMPRLAASPDVSRAVMAAVYAENSGWDWLRRGLQTLSSPGLAVASGLALVVALAGALLLAMNGSERGGIGSEPESTIAAIAAQPLPTDVPTKTPVPPPTATTTPPRVVAPAPASQPTRTPAPRPTATRTAIVEVANPAPELGVGGGDPAVVEQPIIEPVDEAPVLALAPEGSGEESATTDLAQTAVEPAAESAPVQEVAAEAAAPIDAAPAAESDNRKSGRKEGDGGKTKDAAVAAAEPAAPVATHEIGPVLIPAEAIEAMEDAGTAPDVYLPPPPLDPMMPPQDFLPVTPTPEGDGTPTPEPETQADAPQLAEEWSDDLGVAALAPEPPPDVTTIEDDTVKSREKRDKSSKAGKSHEEQQAANVVEPMSWWSEGVELPQTAAEPVALAQTVDEPAAGEPIAAEPVAATGETAATTDQAPQIDPATGLEIDPVSGLLIDPATGYLIDIANGRLIDPRTGYLVDPMTGLLEDPATGALLDPNTLAIVIPAGFGSDTPVYDPGSPDMRGAIEAVVDETYDNATYKVIPPTDGPVQPVGEIVVPTTSGDALEIQ